ncbi:D-arabinono-1,4-lactone oxidase [uncultured Agrococcus sp.]|uniref:D-arabinono-1,4-lactone oxidase n=1 Tax=uncultured Agrococcus sp. TaxID=382258 RepID=UPI0025EB8FBC|nr:D-arabinono-1,4-lactone oxidase [uncultured Agrococcus sp.]
MTWRNWGRTFSAEPAGVVVPESVEELQRLVSAQRGTGVGVKPVGASHSFSAVAQPEGFQLRLDHFRGLVQVDSARRRATFGAGTHLHQVAELLEPFGLALPNMGDIDRQTLAGAISTGTHGTGIGQPSIGANVTAVRLVNGKGELVEVSEDVNYELLPAVRLGLGALGVIVEVEIQCVPEFRLDVVEATEPRDLVVEEWDARIRGNDHFEFFWFPHTDVVTTKTNNRTERDARPLPPAKRWLDEVVTGGALHGAVSEVGARIPAATPAINRLAAPLMERPSFVDRSDRVFVSHRPVRFREMEFGVPVDAVAPVLAEIERLFERRDYRVTFPIEVRAAAADTAMLSTAYEREVAYIALHTYVRQDPRALFADAQRIFLAHEGRPHWGKMHSVSHERFMEELPRFEDFLAVRDRYDPDRVFVNEYTRRVLGE